MVPGLAPPFFRRLKFSRGLRWPLGVALATGTLLLAGLAADRAAAQALPAPVVQQLPIDAPTRVLFVGNSYFYYNDSLHNHVQRLVASGHTSAPPPPLEYKSSTISGSSLIQHDLSWLTTPGRLGVKEPFEVVVLADGSAQPLSPARRAQSRTIIQEHAKTIRQRGGEVALYMTPVYVPPHRQARPDNLGMTARHYIEVGNEIRALVIPVALAFDEAYRRRPNIALHADFDGTHPSLLGTYLAACVTYSSLYERPCKGNPYDYHGRIKADDAAYLQEVGDEVVGRFFQRQVRP